MPRQPNALSSIFSKNNRPLHRTFLIRVNTGVVGQHAIYNPCEKSVLVTQGCAFLSTDFSYSPAFCSTCRLVRTRQIPSEYFPNLSLWVELGSIRRNGKNGLLRRSRFNARDSARPVHIRSAPDASIPVRPLIAGNWKMNGLALQLRDVETVASAAAAAPRNADILICVPATLVARAVGVASGRLEIGGEDCHTARAGAFTGDVSAEMLADAGASAVIVGHSERRQYHHETDKMVAAKSCAAWESGLLSIICIGESDDQRRVGSAKSVIARQIFKSVPKAARSANVVIAYEPIWAIGNGRTADPTGIEDMHRHIRECLARHLISKTERIRILYGGSVDPGNAAAILHLPEVDGALVGSASLSATEFEAVLSSAPKLR
jgi:triosephosphate isomerase